MEVIVYIFLLIGCFILAWCAGYQYCVARVYQVKQGLTVAAVETDDGTPEDAKTTQSIKYLVNGILDFTLEQIDLFHHIPKERGKRNASKS